MLGLGGIGRAMIGAFGKQAKSKPQVPSAKPRGGGIGALLRPGPGGRWSMDNTYGDRDPDQGVGMMPDDVLIKLLARWGIQATPEELAIAKSQPYDPNQATDQGPYAWGRGGPERGFGGTPGPGNVEYAGRPGFDMEPDAWGKGGNYGNIPRPGVEPVPMPDPEQAPPMAHYTPNTGVAGPDPRRGNPLESLGLFGKV